ncbi:MAG: hypothetical protein ABS77_00005 [Phenylobacterium sp. SCN 69-14]|nr:MAG: hypothetical protein ABS77_00005 [Phenylobacterium sp. SCN 69-14]
MVRFADLGLGPNAVGYGAAGHRRDEITIADGQLYLVRPGDAGGAKTRHRAAMDEGALMLQLVPVEEWAQATELGSVPSLEALGAVLDDAVRSAGCGGGAKLAFRIETRVRRAVWSLDTLPARAELVTESEPAVIVGLYATEDAARHAMPAGRRFHAHIVFPTLDLAGHLREVDLEGGSNLQLQAR